MEGGAEVAVNTQVCMVYIYPEIPEVSVSCALWP